jgi:hypothetical protein
MSNGIAALVAVLIINGLMGMIFALNLWRASDWVARGYANMPSWLRQPWQANSKLYRFTGGLQVAFSFIALIWIAVRVE